MQLSTGDMAKHCSVSNETILAWIKAGKIQACQTPGKHFRVEKEEFLRFLQAHKMPAYSEKNQDRVGRTDLLQENIVVLPKANLTNMLERMAKKFQIYGPVSKGSNTVFDAITSFDQLTLNYVSTILPPKKYLLPSKEELLSFNLRDNTAEEVPRDTQPVMLFGIHSCDMQGILRLDYAFSKERKESNYYGRRKQIAVVGITCTADDYCFCDVTHSQERSEGFDLFLVDIGQSYYINILSDLGRELLSESEVTKATEVDIEAAAGSLKRCTCESGSAFKPDVASLPLLCKNGEDLPFWDEIGERCLSCGTCNIVCPTCYCFDIQDEVDLSMEKGKRLRFWDSCQVEGFTEIASGESFRKERAVRQKHRFYRKFRYLMSEYGSPFCVGCGRCRRQCVAKISIVEIANKLEDGVNEL